MFEKLMRAASGVSRREFFGKLGRGAVAVATAAAGVAVTASEAQAARCPEGQSLVRCSGGLRGEKVRHICCPRGAYCSSSMGTHYCSGV